jgi:Zn-dependent protease with chaperone function
MRRGICLAILLLAGAAFAADAEMATAVEPQIAAPAEPRFTTPAMHGRGDIDAATMAYVSQLPPEATARSDAYFEGGYWLILWDALLGVAIAFFLLETGLSARMREVAERATRFKFLQTCIHAAAYFLAFGVLSFPLDVYENFVREHKYGLSNQTFAQWMGDQGKALLLTLILGPIVVSLIYLVVRKLRESWALWGSIVAIACLVVVVAISPVFISPMFNTYKPLPESPLKEKIVSLARANGIPAGEVWEFDASKQTKRMSANVSGMFGTTRISLNDNLMNRASPEEIQAVLGHEMGHYVLNHAYKFILMLGVLILIIFSLTKAAMESALRRFGPRWKLRDVADIAGLPLALAILGLLFLLATPLNNSIVRSQEAEADMFGLNAARQPDGFARAALHLSEYRKMHPGPLEEIVFFDHPSGWNRIHRAMTWKAEHLNDPDIAATNR